MCWAARPLHRAWEKKHTEHIADRWVFFFFSVSLSDLMVRIPGQSGQYPLSLVAVGRWDRDWGWALWLVTKGSMGRGGGQAQGFCPVGIRSGYGAEWEDWGECGRCGKGVENCSSVFLTLAPLGWAKPQRDSWLLPRRESQPAERPALDLGPSPPSMREVGLPWSSVGAPPRTALALSSGIRVDFRCDTFYTLETCIMVKRAHFVFTCLLKKGLQASVSCHGVISLPLGEVRVKLG